MGNETQLLLRDLTLAARGLAPGQFVEAVELRERAKVVLRYAFGEGNRYLKRLGDLELSNPLTDVERARLLSIIASAGDEYRLAVEVKSGADNVSADSLAQAAQRPADKRVFVVHGHDSGMREGVARFLEKVGLQAIILHERASRGRTIIEKFEDASAVRFAVVLLTADDLGKLANSADLHPRARQNVVFELGYFLGRLGRNNVVALYPADAHLELPSDFGGVVYVPFDGRGAWQIALAREISAAGLPVEVERLVSDR